MPANTSINLTTLDFDSIKSNFKTFLESQNTFNDYDFDSSNFSALLDILAFNTQLNAFYLNMIGNEMFMDSAIQRDSVVSHAKELNYLPRSFRSAYANVNITVTATGNNVASITMPRGTSFTSRLDGKNYTFVTDTNYTFGGSNNVFTANNILIYEGDYISDSYVVNNSNPNRYIISSPTVDTTSVRVTVIEDNGETTLQYLQATSLFELDSTSKVFFIQGAEDGKYEVVFGDGVIGRKPKDRSLVILEYRSCNGELPNGLNTFVSDGAIDNQTNVTVSTNARATGGAISESLTSIKFNAPRAFTTQERAVTSKDYETLLKAEFSEINDITAFGGEDADPPRYGKVIIAIDLEDSDTLPPSKRDIYRNFIKSRSPLSIDPIFTEPNYTYIEVHSTVKYDINLTSLNESDVKSLVESAILDYNTTNLNGFDKTLRYSKLVAAIDNAQSSILSNDTELHVIKTFVPTIGVKKNYDIDFNVVLKNDIPQLDLTHPNPDINIIHSTSFLYNNRQVFIEDNGNGTLYLMTNDRGIHKPIQEIGTVDYDRGTLQLQSLQVDGYTGSEIAVHAIARESDIAACRCSIISIREQDINVTVVPLRGGENV